MSKVMPFEQRKILLLQMIKRERQLDVLNRYAVDEYIDATGASWSATIIGANKCPLMGRDLSTMARMPLVLVTRHATGIGDGLCYQGFPRWVWSYRLSIKGENELERSKGGS